MDDWDTGVPAPGAPEAAAEPEGPPTCPWCAARVRPEDTHCRDCGAAVAQRESIGGLKIAGLTAVDAALEDYDKRPLHLRGPSPTQGAAPALIIGAMAGGPIGMIAIGGVAAVAAAELMGTKQDGPEATRLEDVGKPSEALLLAIERADAADAAGDPDGAAADSESQPDAAEPDHADDEGGRSIWRDMPNPEGADEEQR